MKFSFALVFLLTFVSCGKNAFLNSKARRLPGVNTDNRESHVSIKPSHINFDYIDVNDKKDMEITITNDGDFDIDSLNSFGNNENYELDLKRCSRGLELGESCEAKVYFKSSDVIGQKSSVLRVAIGETNAGSDINVTGEVLSLDDDNGGLVAEYLNKARLDFGTTYIGSTYKKLIHIGSKSNDLELRNFYPKNDNNLSLGLSTGELACSGSVKDGCFIELSFRPEEIGRYKSEVLISYIDKANNTGHVLKIDIKARIVEFEECFDFSEQVHLAKNQRQLNQYELALAYPYYSKVENSKRTLESVLNTAFTREMDIYEEVLKFNENTQVFFSYDLNRREESVYSARLLLNLLKYEDIKNDSYDTEVLCSLDYKVCSGKRFIERSYYKLINHDFKVVNDDFSDELVHSNMSLNKGLKFYRHKSAFDMSDYLELTERHIETSIDDNGSMSFVVADDTKLEDSPILVTSRRHAKSCN